MSRFAGAEAHGYTRIRSEKIIHQRSRLLRDKGVPGGRKIGGLVGERVSRGEARRRIDGKRIISCVEIDPYWRIDASRIANALAFVNHSCQPNARVAIRFGPVEFYALRRISQRAKN